MNLEIYLPQARGLIVPDSDLVRPSIVEALRGTVTDIDSRRQDYLRKNAWGKGSVWFHSLQDTGFLFWSGFLDLERKEGRLAQTATHMQACFVKDLDGYLAGFPQEEAGMKRLFQAVYDAGTSFYWRDDIERLRELDGVYNEINGRVIVPWVHAS